MTEEKTIIAKIAKKARLVNGWVQLDYVKREDEVYKKRRWSIVEFASALPVDQVPFWKKLNKGVKIIIYYKIHYDNRALDRIELMK